MEVRAIDLLSSSDYCKTVFSTVTSYLFQVLNDSLSTAGRFNLYRGVVPFMDEHFPLKPADQKQTMGTLTLSSTATR